jgi:hypothetical protein
LHDFGVLVSFLEGNAYLFSDGWWDGFINILKCKETKEFNFR